jgi:hypothetical protein
MIQGPAAEKCSCFRVPVTAGALASLLMALCAVPATTQERPAPRACHSAAASNRGVVIWGGARACGVGELSDSALWLWNGTIWRRETGPRTLPREDALLVYSSADSALVLLGGRRAGQAFADVWRRDQSGWSALPASGGPGAIQHGAAAYDPVHRRTVVFGGAVGRTFSNRTFEWDGTRWHVFDVPGPAPRVGHGMAWSQADGGVLLYGGFQENQFRDLWKWDGTRWQQLNSAGPTYTEGHVVAEADSGIFIIGPGLDNGSVVRIWRWHRGTFTPLGGAGPPVRVGATATFDRARRILLYWGGSTSSGGASAVTHEFDGVRWR